mmetsp:Transcript_9296/g.20243  ORF Transcript_9296/g.20243 Transcript_9296/m.20243 type:complete len:528 (-) Transcript_9296:1091-2674(-)
MIRHPDATAAAGSKESQIVSHSDLFPTIAELAGVPLDKSTKKRYNIEGRSFGHLVRNVTSQDLEETLSRVEHKAGHSWSYPVSSSFSVWPVCYHLNSSYSHSCRKCVSKKKRREVDCEYCESKPCLIKKKRIWYIGVSVRTQKHRYTEWRKYDQELEKPIWDADGLDAVELYDHAQSHDEINNVANNPMYKGVISTHSNMLRARFVPCKKDATEAVCEAIGSHCIFLQSTGVCISRSFCGFSGPESKSKCLERAEACSWHEDRCINKRAGERRTLTPTPKPTVEKQTEFPTRHPTFCRILQKQKWFVRANTYASCVNKLSGKSERADLCRAVTPTDTPPVDAEALQEWKKLHASKCNKLDGCQWVGLAANECQFNPCYNRNGKTCTIQHTGGMCVSYTREDGVVGEDGNMLSGCFKNPCNLASPSSSLDTCAKHGDSKYKCANQCNNCIIENTYRTRVTTCTPCTNTRQCWAKSAKKCVARRIRQGRFNNCTISPGRRYSKGCGCRLKACPHENPYLSQIKTCNYKT